MSQENLIYSATPPTLADGQRTSFQVDSAGRLITTTVSSVPGTGATSLGKAEDGAHTSGDVGVMTLAVRNDANATFGADLDYTPLNVDSSGRQKIAPSSFSASATFTPANTSHVTPDVNGGAQQFSTVGVSGERVMITSATLEIDGGSAEATAWRLYLYNITPPSAIADDATWDLPSGDRASFLGYVDLGTAIDLGSTQWVEAHGINKQIKLASANVFGYLVNLTTVTPAAVAHIVTIHTVSV